MFDGKIILRFLGVLAFSVLAGAANLSFDLSGRFSRMTGIILSDTAGTLWVVGLTGLLALVSFQVLHWDDKLHELLILGRRLRFEEPGKSGKLGFVPRFPDEWCIYVRNRSRSETITNIRALLVGYRRPEWPHSLPVGRELVEVQGRDLLAPGDTLIFRLAKCEYGSEVRAVLLAPGTSPEDWLQKASYVIDVEVFGQNTAPDVDCYQLGFLDGQPGSTFGRYKAQEVEVASPMFNPSA